MSTVAIPLIVAHRVLFKRKTVAILQKVLLRVPNYNGSDDHYTEGNTIWQWICTRDTDATRAHNSPRTLPPRERATGLGH